MIKVKSFAMEATEIYNDKFSFEMKMEVGEIENRVRENKGRTSNEQVDEEIFSWLPDLGFSRSRDTKFLNIVDLYWHMKIFVAMIVEVKDTQHNEILAKLDQVDQKYESLINAIWGSKEVNDVIDGEVKPAMEKEEMQRKAMEDRLQP
jgi:hypothetical protein